VEPASLPFGGPRQNSASLHCKFARGSNLGREVRAAAQPGAARPAVPPCDIAVMARAQPAQVHDSEAARPTRRYAENSRHRRICAARRVKFGRSAGHAPRQLATAWLSVTYQARG
jgi:hypothetical protein